MAKIRRLFVDTAGWGCYVDRQHPLHASVVALYQESIKRRRMLVTTNYVLSELVPLLRARLHLSHAQMVEMIDAILTSPHIEVAFIERHMHDEAWNLLKQRQDKEWSLVDASSFVLMQRLGVTEALTTDHHFSQAGFVRLPVQQP